MRIAILSDQHGSLPDIPPCDLMVLSGDLTGGNPHGLRDATDHRWRDWLNTDFARWVDNAPFTIAIAGNHDTALEFLGLPSSERFRYLRDSGCVFGGLRFWGAPWIRKWDSTAFNLTEEEMEKRMDLVPVGTDVMVCHMPPFGAGDVVNGSNPHRVGSVATANAVWRVRPKLVTCGHIHEAAGEYELFGARVVNAALRFREVEL